MRSPTMADTPEYWMEWSAWKAEQLWRNPPRIGGEYMPEPFPKKPQLHTEADRRYNERAGIEEIGR